MAALVDRAAEPEGVASLVFGQAVVPSDLAPVLSWVGGDRSLFAADRDSACVTRSAGSPSQRHAIRNDCRRRPVSMGPNDLRVLHATQFAPWLDLGAHDDISLSEVGANAIVGRVW
jgi:hypothetical protein